MSQITIRASSWIFYEKKVLLVKEGKENRHYGKWNLPGGHIENFESLTDAVKREIKEETGLSIKLSGILGIYSCFSNKHYIHIVFKSKPLKGKLKAQAGEILSLSWFSYEDIKNMPESAFVYPEVFNKMVEDSLNKKSFSLDYLNEFGRI